MRINNETTSEEIIWQFYEEYATLKVKKYKMVVQKFDRTLRFRKSHCSYRLEIL